MTTGETKRDLSIVEWLALIEREYRPGGGILGHWQEVSTRQDDNGDTLLDYVLSELRNAYYDDDPEGGGTAEALHTALRVACNDLHKVMRMLELTFGAGCPGRDYAVVTWSFEDVLEKRKGWTPQQAGEWLERNERQIRDDMVERGWESIEALLPADEGDNLEDEEDTSDDE